MKLGVGLKTVHFWFFVLFGGCHRNREKASAMSFVFHDFMVRFDSLFTALYFIERIWTRFLPLPGFCELFLIKGK